MSERESHTERHVPEEATEPEAVEEIEISDEAAAVLADLKAELDEAIAARKRALADFANYQRRAADNEVRARRQGAADVIRSLIAVLDHFDLALERRPDQMTVQQLFGGVKMVHDELGRALASHGVTRIEPAPGDELDPVRHAAVLQQPADGIAANHITGVLQPGYAFGDLVLRPAKVAVAPPEQEP